MAPQLQLQQVSRTTPADALRQCSALGGLRGTADNPTWGIQRHRGTSQTAPERHTAGCPYCVTLLAAKQGVAGDARARHPPAAAGRGRCAS